MTRQSLTKRVRTEMIGYAINVVYLSLVFGAFTMYRRLVLATHDISYTNYGVAFIEAFILGKVISLGSVLRLGRGLENKALIIPTLYKTVVFCLFVAAFKCVEHGIKGMWAGDGFMAGAANMWREGVAGLLANTLVVFASLLPFFAVKECARALGRETLWDLFFRRSPDPAPTATATTTN